MVFQGLGPFTLLALPKVYWTSLLPWRRHMVARPRKKLRLLNGTP